MYSVPKKILAKSTCMYYGLGYTLSKGQTSVCYCDVSKEEGGGGGGLGEGRRIYRLTTKKSMNSIIYLHIDR